MNEWIDELMTYNDRPMVMVIFGAIGVFLPKIIRQILLLPNKVIYFIFLKN